MDFFPADGPKNEGTIPPACAKQAAEAVRYIRSVRTRIIIGMP